jgi:hypothetical protein
MEAPLTIKEVAYSGHKLVEDSSVTTQDQQQEVVCLEIIRQAIQLAVVSSAIAQLKLQEVYLVIIAPQRTQVAALYLEVTIILHLTVILVQVGYLGLAIIPNLLSVAILEAHSLATTRTPAKEDYLVEIQQTIKFRDSFQECN